MTLIKDCSGKPHYYEVSIVDGKKEYRLCLSVGRAKFDMVFSSVLEMKNYLKNMYKAEDVK